MMTEFLCDGRTFAVSREAVLARCSHVRDCPSAFRSPYRVKSPVSGDAFREFATAFERHAVITPAIADEFACLCEEFGVSELHDRGLAIRAPMRHPPFVDSEAWAMIAAIEDRLSSHVNHWAAF